MTRSRISLPPSIAIDFQQVSKIESRVCMVGWKCGVRRTRGKALLELVGLLGVLEDKGVQEALAADLELDLLVLAVLLDPGGCRSNCLLVFNSVFTLHGLLSERKKKAKRTGSVLPAADLNELLDIGDFARHGDG